MTEEEQLESIKKWWSRYKNIINTILSLLLLGFVIYQYWNWHHEKINGQASGVYEQMMLALSNQDNTATTSYANALVEEYPNTIYADVARMSLAKLLINKDELAQAKGYLQKVANESSLPAFKQIARIRIARLMVTEKAYDKALQEVSTVADPAYMPAINELKGDIFAAMGRYQEAILSYKEAITAVRTHGMGNLFLEMKTNALAALTQANGRSPIGSTIGNSVLAKHESM